MSADDLAFLRAEAGVRQLYAHYADAVWRKDRAAFEQCFAPDATWKISGQHIAGREACGNFFAKSIAVSELVSFWSGPIAVTVEGEEVSGRLQATELIKRESGSVRTLGLYYDRYVEQDGRWRFAWHHFDMVYFGPPDLSAGLIAFPDYGAPPGQPGADTPTTIRKA